MMTSNSKPGYAVDMERSFGPSGQAAFGSAVFFEKLNAGDHLENAALRSYRRFVGDLWDRWGESAWMEVWKEIYRRGPDTGDGIIAELAGLDDAAVRSSADRLLNGRADAAEAQKALSAACDDPLVTDLSVYRTGDGDAMSGLLIAVRRASSGEALMLVFLMD